MIATQSIYNPLYLDKEHFIILITGGRGSGKSFNASTFIERLTFEKSEDRTFAHCILYTRYTMVSAHMSIIPEMLEKVELDGTNKYFRATKTDIINNRSKGAIMFRGIKTSSGNQTAKLKSIHGITTFVCDEAEEWTDESDFDKIMLSIRQKGIQNRIIIIMNPTDSNHFIYQKYIRDTHRLVEIDGVQVQISTHPNVLHIHTTYLDNIEHLSDEFLNEVRRMKEENPEKYAHTVIGRWSDVAEGAIYKKWGVVKRMPDGIQKIALGVDFGFTHDPTAIIMCGIMDDALYIDELCYRTNMLSRDIITVLKKYPDMRVIADSADPRLIQEIANAGIRIYPVEKGPGSIIAGIEKTKEFKMFVTERSYNTMKELRNYVWDKDKDGHYVNAPADGQADHCFTGDTPITTMRGQIPISEITTDDYVLTSCGYRKVEKVFNNGFKKTLHIRLIFTNFIVELKATPDHKIKTAEGWKQLQELTSKDVLYLYKPLTDCNIRYIPGSDISQGDVKDCIGLYGSTITELYPKDAMFTIKTATLITTTSRILNSWREVNIFPTILKNTSSHLKRLQSCVAGWIPSANLQASGMGLKRVLLGIGSMAKRLLKRFSPLSSPANGAERNSCQNLWGTVNFAPMDAEPRQGITRALTTKQGCADNAEKNLSPINTLELTIAHVNAQDTIVQMCDLKGIEIVREDLAEVYDIQVADMHEYFANGVLVHNCCDAFRYYVLGVILGKIRISQNNTGIFNH